MQMRNDSENVYRRKLDKWKARSNRILTKAYNLNRTYDNHLEYVLKDLERSRDLSIREAQEKIWNVSNAQCPRPRLARQTDMPSYLANPKVVSLPTPAELSSLLPKKVVKAKPEARKQYTRMSTRKLSTMSCDQVKVTHYRQLINNDDPTPGSSSQSRDDSEKEAQRAVTTTLANGDLDVDNGLENIPMGVKRHRKTSTYSEEPTIHLHDPTNQPQPRPMSSPPKHRKKVPVKVRPKTGMHSDPGQGPSGKVWKTNYLQMYHIQADKHKMRMSLGTQVPFQLSRSQLNVNNQDDTKPPDDVINKKKQSVSDVSFSKRGLHNRLQVQNEKQSPASTLMSPTASSDKRRNSARALFRRVNSVNTMDALHQEVKNIEQARQFRNTSLKPADDDLKEEYLEEGELFDSMRKCRYIRWGDDKAKIEELNEDIPLENHLKVLSLSAPKCQIEIFAAKLSLWFT